jgi:Tol biopolymer transport system component
LWPSISPDGSKIVYYVAGSVWVCDINGTNPQRIGKFHAPKWYNNNVVVGMNDQDNGEIVTSSKIVAAKADGTSGQNLTEDTSMAMYPTVSLDGSRISYSTPAGELYIINIAK